MFSLLNIISKFLKRRYMAETNSIVEKSISQKQYSRRIQLSGTKNFRDLGGYPTVDGKFIRWGVLYRSDSLHKLTKKDLQKLALLKLSYVFDFRSENEVAQEPDRLVKGIKLIRLPMLDASTKIWHEQRNDMVKNMKTLNPPEFLRATNSELATKFTPEYKIFYQELLKSKGDPILFHCAAGKDRTGFAAATLLRILGVSHDIVLQDYLLTNRYFLDSFKLSLFIGTVLKGRKFINGIRGFMIADKSYLNAAFEALEEEYGSFENYVHDGLGLTNQDIVLLKKYYLE